MEINIIDILQGSLSLIFVLISFVIGISIISKYGKYKNRLYILVGLTWLMLSTLWLPEAVSFLMSLIIRQTLAIEWYFILGNVFVPVALFCWVVAYTDMVNKEKEKIAVALILIFSVVFEGLFFYNFVLDIDFIGVIDDRQPFSADLGIFLAILLLISILILFVTGIMFARKSIKSENKEVRLKGKLLQFAFIAFTIAAVLEKTIRSILMGIVFLNPTEIFLSVVLVVVRLLLISSTIAFYGGFLLPNWMKNLFTK